MSMMDRIFLLSHSKYYEETLRFIINSLLENDYPIKFIFNMINLFMENSKTLQRSEC